MYVVTCVCLFRFCILGLRVRRSLLTGGPLRSCCPFMGCDLEVPLPSPGCLQPPCSSGPVGTKGSDQRGAEYLAHTDEGWEAAGPWRAGPELGTGSPATRTVASVTLAGCLGRFGPPLLWFPGCLGPWVWKLRYSGDGTSDHFCVLTINGFILFISLNPRQCRHRGVMPSP